MDKRRRDKKALKHKESLKKGNGFVLCGKCGKQRPQDEFITSRGEPSKKCSECLGKQQRVELKRERDQEVQRERYRKYEQTPARKEKKREYVASRPVETRMGYTIYRLKKKKEDGPAFLEKNAKQQKLWIEANPEMYNAEPCRAPVMQKLYSHKSSSARGRGIENNITDEQAVDMFNSDCWYCGEPPGESLNGIDRLDSTGHYTVENTRGCCKHCNYSKGALPLVVFIAQCARVASHNNPDRKWEFKPLYEKVVIKRYTGGSYSSVKHGAESRGLLFELTPEQVAEFNTGTCYLCGHHSKTRNGIDRVDSNIGYIMSNCQSCCSECNLMKRAEDLQSFVNRCTCISESFIGRSIDNIECNDTLRMRYDKRLHQPDNSITLDRRTKSSILNQQRVDMINWAGESYPVIYSRYTTGNAIDGDKEKLDHLEELVNQAYRKAADERNE